jgi:hypothetical protein
VAKRLRLLQTMGKVKSSDSSRLRKYVSDFKDVFTSDGKVLFVSPVENLSSHNIVLKLHNI